MVEGGSVHPISVLELAKNEVDGSLLRTIVKLIAEEVRSGPRARCGEGVATVATTLAMARAYFATGDNITMECTLA